jgi:hypothetical protein
VGEGAGEEDRRWQGLGAFHEGGRVDKIGDRKENRGKNEVIK